MIGSSFRSAIDRGYLMRNSMANVLKPKSNKQDKKVRALTVEEQQLFTDYLFKKDISNCKYKNVYLIQMFMGLRVSEALALTTHDIDLAGKKLNVRRTLTKDELGILKWEKQQRLMLEKERYLYQIILCRQL